MINRKSIYLDCIGSGSTEEKLVAAAAAGFAAVEMPSIPENERAAVKELFKKYDLICPSIMTTGAWNYPATSPDADIRAKSADCFKLAVDTATDMGCDTILTVPGAVTPDITYEMAWENGARTLAMVVPYAEAKGITMAIENVWNKFLLSPREMVQFVDSFGSDYVKSYFDIGNIVIYGFPQHWIKSLGSRIKRVHIKGFAMKGFESFAWTQLLESTIDWKAVTSALKEIGYDGWVTAELGPDARGLKGIAEDMDHILGLA
ncbi:MAG: sugar phosphate isomerase/epimerase family protein [Eubacteriales bacterium]